MPRLSLKVEILIGAGLMLACRCGPPPQEDTAWWNDSGPRDSGECRRVAETGIAELYYRGDFATDAGTFVDSHFGYGMRSLSRGEWLCEVTGELLYEGEGAAGCPDCEWSFDLSGVRRSTAAGADCALFGITDGALDTAFDYSWGYSPVYYYDYGGTPIALEQSLMMYLDSTTGWFAFAFNYGGRSWVYGDGEDLTVVRPAFTSTSSYAYYYYYTGDYTYSPRGCAY